MKLFPDSFWLPLATGLGVVLAASGVFGFLILRRRGVYFALLTLALSAMLYAVAFRWTEVTGGENGLGGITRPAFIGVSFEVRPNYYVLVAIVALLAVYALWRFHRSPVGTVLIAIRENEQRARFLGYPTDRYKLVAFVTLGDAHRAGRHAAAVQQPHDVGRSDLGGFLRRTAGDGRSSAACARFSGPRWARCSS